MLVKSLKGSCTRVSQVTNGGVAPGVVSRGTSHLECGLDTDSSLSCWDVEGKQIHLEGPSHGTVKSHGGMGRPEWDGGRRFPASTLPVQSKASCWFQGALHP